MAKKLETLPHRQIGAITKEIISAMIDAKRTPAAIAMMFRKRGFNPPSDVTIYRIRKEIRDEETRNKHAQENGIKILEKDLVSLSKILAIRNIKEEIGEEQFKQILSLIM